MATTRELATFGLLLAGGVLVVGLARKGGSMKVSQVPAKYFGRGRRAKPIWIVIHTAEVPEVPTAAESLAAYAASMPDGRHVSWHYAVDSDSATQSVQESDTAWSAGPGNDHGIHIELAGTAAQSADQWGDAFSVATLKRAAQLTAEIARRWDIPLVHPTTEDVLALRPGVIGHDQISAASALARQRNIRSQPWYGSEGWRSTNHGDPGPRFPWSLFIDEARAARANPPLEPSAYQLPPRTRLGDRGEAVKAWQSFLNTKGYGPLMVDGIHGKMTEAASVAWEKASA